MECAESKIRDISLAEYGRKEIDIAEVEMPGKSFYIKKTIFLLFRINGYQKGIWGF